MSMSICYGVYNTYKKLLKSFDSYLDAFDFIKTLKDKDYIEVDYLFQGVKKVFITKVLYIQRFIESGGGVEAYGAKYYFSK